MTLKEIKEAVNAGKTVHWSNEYYTVTKNWNIVHTDWNIVHTGGHCIGLYWGKIPRLNGKEEDFYIEGER